MGIRPNFKLADIQKKLYSARQRINAAIIQVLKRLGELCVAEARDNGGYTDRTGNLRSSIGYLIVFDGQIVDSAFETANQDLNDKGKQTGEIYAKSLANNYSTGYVLIVVAGMNYAAKVESLNKNVLTSAEMYANKELPKMLKQLSKNIDKMRA